MCVVMVSILATSAVDCGSKPCSGWFVDYNIGICCVVDCGSKPCSGRFVDYNIGICC